MKCEYCGHANLGGDPFDNSCRGCQADPDNPEFAAGADEAADNRRQGNDEDEDEETEL